MPVTPRIKFLLAGVLTVASFIIVLDIYRPGLLWKASSLPRSPEQKKVESLLANYRLGEEQQKEGLNFERACLGLQGSNLSVCLQGYIDRQLMSVINDSRIESQEPLDNNLPIARHPAVPSLWYLGLGMGLANAEKSPEDVRTRLQNSAFYSYVVDGWAFMEVRRKGLLATLEACLKFGQISEQQACLFGVGRSSFYAPTQLAQLTTDAPKELVNGYLFAKIFSLEDEAAAGKNPAVQLAQSALKLWRSDRPENSVQQCLVEKYTAQCLSSADTN